MGRRARATGARGIGWLASMALVGGCAHGATGEEVWAELGSAGGGEPVTTGSAAQRPPCPTCTTAKRCEGAIGWTSEGQLALFDTLTGALVDEAPGRRHAWLRDVAFDPAGLRAAVLESDAQGTTAQVRTVELRRVPGRALSWGHSHHLGGVDGPARLWPVPDAVVVFETSPAVRWRLLRDDGRPTASLFAPVPEAAWAHDSPLGLELGAVGTRSDGSGAGVARVQALVGAEGFTDVTIEALAPEAGAPGRERARRFSPWPLGQGCAEGEPLLAAEVAERSLTFTLETGCLGEPVGSVRLAEAAESVAALAVLPERRLPADSGPEATVTAVALLTEPARLLVAELGPELVVAHETVITLPSDASAEDAWLGRTLLPLAGRRLLVATPTRLWAVDLDLAASGEAPVEREFHGAELRGPLAGPVPLVCPD